MTAYITLPDPNNATDAELAAAVTTLDAALDTEVVDRQDGDESLAQDIADAETTLNTAIANVASASFAKVNAGKVGETVALRSNRQISRRYIRNRAALFGGMTPVSTRPSHGLTTQSNGTDTYQNSRIKQVAPCDISSLALEFCNYQNGEIITNLGTITVSAAIEYAGAYYPVFFNGSRTVSLAPGAFGVVSSPVGVTIPVGSAYYIRTYTTATSGQRWPHMLTSRSADGEGSVRGTGTNDLTTSGTITAASEGVYTAQAVLANVTGLNFAPYDCPVIGGVGDSIMNGLGEATPETDRGFFNRALGDAFARVKFDRSGSTITLFVGANGATRRLPMLDGCTTVIEQFGVNDLNTGRTLSQLQADVLTLAHWCYWRGIRVIRTTLTPWTTSTDNWTTAINQTATSWEATRINFNSWLRDGAPIDPTTHAALAVGTVGALRKGDLEHPIYDVHDTAAALETSLNSGKWKPGSSAGTISTTNGSPTVTVTTGSFATGEILVATGIPAGTTILSGGGTATLTLSANATATAADVAGVGAHTADGIHPSGSGHALMATAIDTGDFI